MNLRIPFPVVNIGHSRQAGSKFLLAYQRFNPVRRLSIGPSRGAGKHRSCRSTW